MFFLFQIHHLLLEISPASLRLVRSSNLVHNRVNRSGRFLLKVLFLDVREVKVLVNLVFLKLLYHRDRALI